MIGAFAFALQIAAAQPPNLVVRHAENLRVVPSIATTAGRYIRADLLATALGGSSGSAAAGRYRITLGESLIELTEGVPFVRIDANVIPMLLPPLRSGQTFLVPYQLATSVIPRFATGFNYDAAAAELRIFDTSARRGVAADPAAASALPLRERFASLLALGPVAAIFLIVVGGIYIGVFTPTEGAAVGAVATAAFAWAMGGLDAAGLRHAVIDAAKLSGMIFIILIGAWNLKFSLMNNFTWLSWQVLTSFLAISREGAIGFWHTTS